MVNFAFLLFGIHSSNFGVQVRMNKHMNKHRTHIWINTEHLNFYENKTAPTAAERTK